MAEAEACSKVSTTSSASCAGLRDNMASGGFWCTDIREEGGKFYFYACPDMESRDALMGVANPPSGGES